MKPLNLDNSPCTPTSSNCVIWQGPNIPCIKLCTGDSVSDVVFKLATELCTIMDTLNVTNYDLACLNLPCPPEDFQVLIQVLINRICELENIPVPPPDGGGDLRGTCPTNCIIEIECLNIGPDTLLNYVTAIGERICSILDEIALIQGSISTINTTLVSLQTQINNIPVYTLPDVSPDCPIGVYVGPTPLDTLFEAFINDVWCPISTVFGTSVQLTSAVASQCITGGDVALQYQYSLPSPLNQIQNQYPSFDSTPSTIADAISNIWIALCDVRNAGHKETVVQAGANITVTSAVAIVGNDEVTTYTIIGDSNPIETKNEGVSLTTTTESIDFVGDLVDATVIGNNVTVTINTFGGMLAQDQPANLNSVAFGLGNVLCFQPVQVIAEVYDDDNAYNPLTGVWTCPTTGRYNLSCYVHYTKDSADGWYDSLNPGGMFGVGIFTSTGCNFYCANWMTVMGIQKHIDISSQAIGIQITAGTQLSVKVLNQTGFNYTSTTGDGIRFSVERIK